MIWICAKCHYIIGTYESENSAYIQVDYVQLPQTIQAIKFCSRITIQDTKRNCKNNLLSQLLPPSGFSTLHISAYSWCCLDLLLHLVPLLFCICLLFHHGGASCVLWKIRVPKPLFRSIRTSNSRKCFVHPNAGVDVAHYGKKIGDLQLIHSSLN